VTPEISTVSLKVLQKSGGGNIKDGDTSKNKQRSPENIGIREGTRRNE